MAPFPSPPVSLWHIDGDWAWAELRPLGSLSEPDQTEPSLSVVSFLHGTDGLPPVPHIVCLLTNKTWRGTSWHAPGLCPLGRPDSGQEPGIAALRTSGAEEGAAPAEPELQTQALAHPTTLNLSTGHPQAPLGALPLASPWIWCFGAPAHKKRAERKGGEATLCPPPSWSTGSKGGGSCGQLETCMEVRGRLCSDFLSPSPATNCRMGWLGSQAGQGTSKNPNQAGTNGENLDRYTSVPRTKLPLSWTLHRRPPPLLCSLPGE